jgi:hypothetical protein
MRASGWWGRGSVVLVAVLVATYLSERGRRQELVETIKDGSDTLINLGLRATSQFGSELTAERLAEQPAFRRRRLRDLH